MSKEQAKEFFEAISKDKQLAEEVKEVLGGQATNSEKASELFGLAKVHGFDFTKSEASSLTKDELKASLKIESLSDVSGGAKGSIKPAVMAAFLLAGMGLSGAAMSNMEASAAPPKVQVEQSINSYDVYTAEDFVNFFTREDYQGQATRGVTITLRSDISLTSEQACAIKNATSRYNPEPGNPYDRSFHGTLDGGGHSITLNFAQPADGWFGGLFTYADGATFRNLHVRFDRLLGASGVFVDTAFNSNFVDVVVIGNSLKHIANGPHNGEPLGFGALASVCLGTCKFNNCVAKIKCTNIRLQMECNGSLSVGGIAGFCQSTSASNCAFSGDMIVSSTGDVHVGGIFGSVDPSHLDGSSIIDSCVVSSSQIKATSDEECTAGAIAGHCVSNSVVRNSAALNCSVNAAGNYTGQIAGAFVPEVDYSPFLLSEAFAGAAQDAPEPQIYGCFYTSEGPAVGRERTPNPSAAAQEDQDSIKDLLPDLAHVIDRLQNPQGQQTSLVSSAFKWVGSWFGFGRKA